MKARRSPEERLPIAAPATLPHLAATERALRVHRLSPPLVTLRAAAHTHVFPFMGAGKLARSDEPRLRLCPAVLSLEITLRLGRD
jgi:hypothetical protein